MDREFDLSDVHTIVADRFRARREAFTTVGAASSISLLVLAVWFGLEGPGGVVIRIGVATWALVLAWYGGAYGFTSARRLAQGPVRLRLDNTGISVLQPDGRTHLFPWKGVNAHFWLSSRNAHVDGIPDYSMVVRPKFANLFPPYRRILPIVPLTRDAFEALLKAAREQGARIVAQPSARFLGIGAPGTAQVFDLPSAPTLP